MHALVCCIGNKHVTKKPLPETDKIKTRKNTFWLISVCRAIKSIHLCVGVIAWHSLQTTRCCNCPTRGLSNKHESHPSFRPFLAPLSLLLIEYACNGSVLGNNESNVQKSTCGTFCFAENYDRNSLTILFLRTSFLESGNVLQSSLNVRFYTANFFNWSTEKSNYDCQKSCDEQYCQSPVIETLKTKILNWVWCQLFQHI